MGVPVVLQDSFDGGIRRDQSRDRLPKNACWDLVDYIPGLDAPLRQRGGWSYKSDEITDEPSFAVVAGIQAPFSSGSQIAIVGEEVGDAGWDLWTVDSSGAITGIGGVPAAPQQNPVFHRDLVIIPNLSAVEGYDGSAMSPISGAPAASYACVFKDRTVLANDGTNANRLWFSGPGDPTSWDTTTSWWDANFPITGLFPLRNAILIFSRGAVERLRGSTPPPGTDFTLDTLSYAGCTDAQSIAAFGDFAVWASPTAIWMSDGAAIVDLTREVGLSTYWRTLMAGYSDTWKLAGGVFQSTYYLTATNNGVFQDSIAIDLGRRRWWRNSNIDAACFWSSTDQAKAELYFGRSSEARVGGLSTIYTPQSGLKNDGDGTPVLPVLETQFYDLNDPAIKRWKAVDLYYDLRGLLADDPAFLLSHISSPAAGDYVSDAPTIGRTGAIDRKKIPIRLARYGLGFKIERIGAASDARIYSVQADAAPMAGQRRYARALQIAADPLRVPSVGAAAPGMYIPGVGASDK